MVKLNYACKSCGRLIKESGRCSSCEKKAFNEKVAYCLIGFIIFVYTIGFFMPIATENGLNVNEVIGFNDLLIRYLIGLGVLTFAFLVFANEMFNYYVGVGI